MNRFQVEECRAAGHIIIPRFARRAATNTTNVPPPTKAARAKPQMRASIQLGKKWVEPCG